ncbi:3-phosphoserine/phosphohydroxythreonine transaminase [soil metagenome]
MAPPPAAPSTAAPASKSARPLTDRIYNFNAGPSYLPDEVIRQIQEDIWNFQGSGMGIMEHSHRHKVYDAVIVEAEAEVRRIARIPANYRILFMTGGSTSQNFLAPMNLLRPGESAATIITGYWGQRTYDDGVTAAHRVNAKMSLAATSADQNHSYIPADADLNYTGNETYIHFTSNNTVFGTQWHRLPPLPGSAFRVCDMCSDIYSRPVNVGDYGLIYASAQKNLGTTGTTIAIIRDDLIERADKALPRMLQYRTFAKDLSMPNTPPAFAIYTVGLMAKWITAQGGLDALSQRNTEKAHVIYDALDATADFWHPHARRADRSLMNIVFRAQGPRAEELDKQFIAEALRRRMDGTAGHRATGGMRVSIYNAFPKAGCEALAELIRDFAAKNG